MATRRPLVHVLGLLTVFTVAAPARADELAGQIQFAAMHADAPFRSYEWPYEFADRAIRLTTLTARQPVGERWAVRVDGGYLQRIGKPGVSLRGLVEHRQPDWGFGVGIAVRDLPNDTNFAVVPAWLRLGPEVLHVRARLFEGGALGALDDLAGVGIGAELRLLGEAALVAGLGWTMTTTGTATETTVGLQLVPVRVLLQWRNVTPQATWNDEFGDTEYTEVGAGVSWVFGKPQARDRGERRQAVVDWVLAKPQPRKRPVPPPVAPSEEQFLWPRTDYVLEPGRIFMMRYGPLRVMEGVTAPVGQESVCLVDEQVRAGGHTWSHLTCAPELPADAPPAWRSGCYVTTDEGIWRLGGCPGDATPVATPARLLVPARPPTPMHGFLDLGMQTAQIHALTLGDTRVRAVCLVRELDSAEEQCFSEPGGLVWSARRWRNRVDARPETAVRVTRQVSGDRADPQAPHLQFARPESARCEAAPACSVFGQCHILGLDCVAARDADCQRATVCARSGHCTALGGRCTVRSDADCQGSEACARSGQCSFRDGRCLALGDDCAASSGCRDLARCTPVAGRCQRISDADCARAAGCTLEGTCHLSEDQCLARDDADCRATEACVLEQRCRADAGRCVVGADPAPTVPAAAR